MVGWQLLKKNSVISHPWRVVGAFVCVIDEQHNIEKPGFGGTFGTELVFGLESMLNKGNREWVSILRKRRTKKWSTKHWWTTRHWKTCVCLWVHHSFKNGTEIDSVKQNFSSRAVANAIAKALPKSSLQGLYFKVRAWNIPITATWFIFPKATQWHFFEFTKFLWRPITKQKFDLSVHFCIPFFLSSCPQEYSPLAGVGGNGRYSCDNRRCNEHSLLTTIVHWSSLFVLFHCSSLTGTFRRRLVHIPKSSRLLAPIQCSRTTLLWRN